MESNRLVKLGSPMLVAVILVVFPFCMLFAATSDLLSMSIANRVPVILAATFLIVAPMTGMDWMTIGWHLLAGGLVLVITFGLFAMGGMGGGDAKLISASAVWMGLGFNLMAYLLVASFLGGPADDLDSALPWLTARHLHEQEPVPAQLRDPTQRAFPTASRSVLPGCCSIRIRRLCSGRSAGSQPVNAARSATISRNEVASGIIPPRG